MRSGEYQHVLDPRQGGGRAGQMEEGLALQGQDIVL